MNKILGIINSLLKIKLLANVFYYSLFFVGSLLIIFGIGNFFGANSFDQDLGITCFFIGSIIIILLWKYKKVF